MMKSGKFIALALIGISTFAISATTVFAADAAAGKAKAAVCGGCHGADGISMAPDIPNLKGQKEVYLKKAIGDYKSGMRKNPIMASMVGNLSDADAADIAAYFSSLK